MNKFIKNVGLGVSALAMSFATVATAPITSLTYAEETKPGCVSSSNDWSNCIYASGSYDSVTHKSTGQYSIRVGGYVQIGSPVSSEAEDYISYQIKDTSVASFATEIISNGESPSYMNILLRAYKPGKTEIVYKLKSSGETLLTVPIETYTLDYTDYQSVAVGSSRTFTITPGSDVEVTNAEIASGLSKYATLKANGGNSYTLTVNEMPYGLIGLGAEEEEALPWINIIISSKNKTTGKKYDDTYMTFNVYETDAEDEASVSASSMAAKLINTAKLRDTANALIDALFAEDTNITNGSVVTLSDGAKFKAADIEGLMEAFQSGKTIQVSIAKPTVLSGVDTTVSDKMEAQIPSTVTRMRYLDINVVVSAGDKVFGNIIEVGSPLVLSIDVSDDPEVPAGYTRTYYGVRMHDGVAERLETTYDKDTKTVSAESDKFSTYLIAYEDTKSVAAPDSGFNTKNAETSSANYAALAALAALVTIFGAAVIIKKHHA